MGYNTTGVVQHTPAASAGKAKDANAGVKADEIQIDKLDALQMALDVIGLIPGAGAPADILNGVISAARGDWLGAGLSLLGVVPVAGEAATVAKIAKGADRYLAAVRKVADEVLPKLPEGVANKLRGALEKAEDKINEIAGRPPVKRGEPPAPQGEGSPGKKIKPKTKPKCGQRGPYKDRNDHDNTGFNWDHVPSKAALLLRAKKVNKGKPLTSKQTTAIEENAPTIAIPYELHKDHSETYGGRQNQKVDGDTRRIKHDSDNLQKAAKGNTDKILESIDDYDKDCKGAYTEAAKAISAITDDEWVKWLDAILKANK